MQTPVPGSRRSPLSASSRCWSLAAALAASLAIGLTIWRLSPLLAWPSSDSERVTAIVLLVWAPVAEELIFRAGLQEALLRRGCGPVASSVWTMCAFGALHALSRSLALGVAVLPASLLLSALYLRCRRAAPCMLLHAALNLGWLLLSR